MLIIGVDPGTAETGIGIINYNQKSKNCCYVFHHCFKTIPGQQPEKRLELIFKEFIRIIKEYKPTVLAIEGLFFNTNAKSATAVGRATGVVMLAAARCKIPVCEYSPLKIKSKVDGYGRAKKNEIQEKVKEILKLKEIPRPNHAADALAVAICHTRCLEKI